MLVLSVELELNWSIHQPKLSFIWWDTVRASPLYNITRAKYSFTHVKLYSQHLPRGEYKPGDPGKVKMMITIIERGGFCSKLNLIPKLGSKTLNSTSWRWDVGFVLRVESSKNMDATPNMSPEIIYIKYLRFDFNGYTPYLNGFLRLKSWDFASMLILANMSGTWDLGLGF